MKLVCLMEDTPGRSGCVAEHGFSLYAETKKHHMVIDTGASGRTWENAIRLGIDPSALDTVILSHGHYDHSGGLIELLGMNDNVAVYMHRLAGEDYFSSKGGLHYIGIDKRLNDSERITLTADMLKIDSELSLFSNVSGKRAVPAGNSCLLEKMPEDPPAALSAYSAGAPKGFIRDRFLHEQYAVIETEGITVLVSGCSHNGILNILDRYKELYPKMPDAVIGGLHMMKDGPLDTADIALIRETALELKATGSVFFAGHCTGAPAYDVLKEIMGDSLRPLHSGEVLKLG